MNHHIKAIQAALAGMNYDPGPIDGLFGDKTDFAVEEWQKNHGAAKPAPSPGTVAGWPKQADVARFYGEAGGRACTAGRVTLPFPFYLAWSPGQKLTGFACHEKVAAPLTSIFAEAAKHYGQLRFTALRLDAFGGCFNFRPMRGGTSLSMHSWGIAVDLDPERNQLKWGRDKAEFAKPAYDAWWNIVEAHGATSLGRAKNMDWMHFQFASI